MSVDRVFGGVPTSASSSLLAEDAETGADYDMEGTTECIILNGACEM